MVISVVRIAARFKASAKVPKPKSRYDRFPKNVRPFDWATPVLSIPGEAPNPWRVSHADSALALLKKLSPQDRDIYVEYESDLYKNRLQLWIGLRDNRDREAHAQRLRVLYAIAQDAGCAARMHEAGGRVVVYLVDDLEKYVLD